MFLLEKEKTTLRHRNRVGSSARSEQKQEKSMISSRFPEIHRLSQNRQTAKSMISSHFPEIHRLSAKKGLGTGDLCRPKGRSAPLACCLPHAGGWKSGQGQATRWVVACRGASGPLDGTASRWHSARSKAEGANTHGSLQGHADAPLPGQMSPSRCKFEELGKYKFD